MPSLCQQTSQEPKKILTAFYWRLPTPKLYNCETRNTFYPHLAFGIWQLRPIFVATNHVRCITVNIVVWYASILRLDARTVNIQRDPGGLAQGFVDLDLRSSPGWWAATVATYCPSRMVEHPKSKSTKPSPRGHGTPCTATRKVRSNFPLTPLYRPLLFHTLIWHLLMLNEESHMYVVPTEEVELPQYSSFTDHGILDMNP